MRNAIKLLWLWQPGDIPRHDPRMSIAISYLLLTCGVYTRYIGLTMCLYA